MILGNEGLKLEIPEAKNGLVGGWTNPVEKTCSSKWVHLPQISGLKKKILDIPTPRKVTRHPTRGELVKGEGNFYRLPRWDTNNKGNILLITVDGSEIPNKSYVFGISFQQTSPGSHQAEMVKILLMVQKSHSKAQPPFGCIYKTSPKNHGRFQLPTSLNWWVDPGFLVAINSGFYPSTSDSTSRSRLGKLGFVWKSWKHVVFVDNNEVLVGGFNPFEKY